MHPNLLAFLQDMSAMFDGIVVTSGNDSTHMIGSRHYINKAIDIGAYSSNKDAYAAFRKYVKENSSALKLKYGLEDIIDEGSHIHIELPLTTSELKVEKQTKYILIGTIIFLFGGFLIYHFKIK